MTATEPRLSGAPEQTQPPSSQEPQVTATALEIEVRRSIRINLLYNAMQDNETRTKILSKGDPMLRTIFADMGFTGVAEEDDFNYVRVRLLRLYVPNPVGDISEAEEKKWASLMKAIEEQIF